MDYSLLIGVDKDDRMLVLGIIDFIRQVGDDFKCMMRKAAVHLCTHGPLMHQIGMFSSQFTLDKALEMYVKKSGLLGGRGKDPTILSPKQYAKRFRQAMPFWFVSVPVGTE